MPASSAALRIENETLFSFCCPIAERRSRSSSYLVKKWVLKPPAGSRFQGVLSGSPDTSHERSLPGADQAPEWHLQHQMCTFLCPLHLLLFGKPLTYDLVYRRFHKARRNRFLITPTLAVIWNECLVDNDVRVEFVERLFEFATILSG